MASFPAPVGGWNARDSLAAMPPTDAVILDNWFPSTTSVSVRAGYESYATGIGTNAVDTLVPYAAPAGEEFFAISGGVIYDISAGGAGSSVVTGLSNSRWQSAMTATSGGNFVVICNGVDTPYQYDGTNWTTVTFTGSGLTTSTLVYPWLHKERLWFVQINTLDAWYLGVGAITGTATKFPLGAVFKLGGYLVAGGTWTRDGGDGMDDLQVFVTSNGEVAVYQGTDPSDASKWALVGVYRIGAPIGRRCMVNLGADLIIVTNQGFLPLSAVLQLGLSQQTAQALSDKIRNAVNDAVAAYGTNFGWQALSFPGTNWGVFNIPVTEGVTSYQFVVNTLTGAWARFTNMDATCWGIYNNELYFGGTDGTVYKAATGYDDDGDPVYADALPAFSDFGIHGRKKRFTLYRALMRSDGTLSMSVMFNVDFAQNASASFPTPGVIAGAPWNTSLWNVSYWADTPQPREITTAVTGYGVYASPRIQISVDAQTVDWLSNDYVFEIGGFL